MNAVQPGPGEAGGKTIFITREREKGAGGQHLSLSSHLILHFIVNSMLSIWFVTDYVELMFLFDICTLYIVPEINAWISQS